MRSLLTSQKKTTVAIQFADTSILTLHKQSRVSFDHLSVHGTTGMVDSHVRLIEGRMDTKVTPATVLALVLKFTHPQPLALSEALYIKPQ